MTGPLRREIADPETVALLRWVSAGGRLVVIDREPPDGVIKTAADWNIGIKPSSSSDIFSVDPSDQNAMTHGTQAAKPSQPSPLTFGVNAVQPSKYASAITIESTVKPKNGTSAGNRAADREDVNSFSAPVIHMMVGGKGLLAGTPFGSGTIIVLSDPYVVSNGGISLVDNAQLAVNIVDNGGPIAFDEFHQGFGGNRNRLAEFFAGTPVVAIFFQCLLIVGVLFFSQSRRFGRALPAGEPDRLSKLEYIAAMAELQQRTKAFDLAIENIYRDFRRRAARLLGVDNMSISRGQFAALIAERAKADKSTVDQLMFKCEEIIAGDPAKRRDAVELTADIRRLEKALGLRRRTSV